MDLSTAAFLDNEVTIDASSFCGKVVITVPNNARVYDTGEVFLRKRKVSAVVLTSGDGPVIRIAGGTVLGKLAVVRASQQAAWPSRR